MKRLVVSNRDPAAARAAEKAHVGRIECTEGLLHKPFLAGTSHDIDRALTDIGIFSAMTACLPCGTGALVLDIGAGPCWVSDWLQRLNFRTCSIDLAADMLAIGLRRLRPGSSACAGDMALLPLRDAVADAVVCYSALHHVPNWQDAIAESFRVLKSGGVLVMQEPGRGHSRQPESIAQMEQFGVLEQDLPPHILVRACRAAGFSRVLVRPAAELSFGRTRLLPPYPAALFPDAPRLFLARRFSRIKATLVERLLNLAQPFHIVVAAKGDVWPDSRRPETMTAKFKRVACPGRAATGQAIPFSTSITNTGVTRWLARTDEQRRGQVRLGISLLDSQHKLLSLDHHRCDLPHDVAPGETVEIAGELPAFTAPFTGGLRFDLVAEGIQWFAARGSKTHEREIVIVNAQAD